MMSGDSIDIVKDFGPEVVKTLAPVVAKNSSKVKDLLNKTWRKFVIKDTLSFEGSMYLSMFVNFKNGHQLEEISQDLCRILDNYRFEEQNDENNIDRIKYNDKIFNIATTYNYSDDAYISTDLIDIEDSSENSELLIPSVIGVSMFVFPEEDKEWKAQLIEGVSFLDVVYNRLMDYYIIAKGYFLYIVTTNHEEKEKIRTFIDKKILDNGEKIKYFPARENELKMKVDKLIATRIGEPLISTLSAK